MAVALEKSPFINWLRRPVGVPVVEAKIEAKEPEPQILSAERIAFNKWIAEGNLNPFAWRSRVGVTRQVGHTVYTKSGKFTIEDGKAFGKDVRQLTKEDLR